MVIQKFSANIRTLGFSTLQATLIACTLSSLSACSLFSGRQHATENDSVDNEKAELKQMITQLNQKIDTMTAKQSQNDEKLKETLTSLESIPGYKKPTPPAPKEAPIVVKTEGVSAAAAAVGGAALSPAVAKHDPEAGFSNDLAVQEYRKSQLLLQSGRYSDAMVSFNSFLERFADHPFAGNAQFAIAESYYLQKEMQPALREYQRVLTSYDRSPKVPEALKRMIEIEESLQMKDEASRHRQTLQALFPQSQSMMMSSSSPSSPNKTEEHGDKNSEKTPGKTMKSQQELDAPPAESKPTEGKHAT